MPIAASPYKYSQPYEQYFTVFAGRFSSCVGQILLGNLALKTSFGVLARPATRLPVHFQEQMMLLGVIGTCEII